MNGVEANGAQSAFQGATEVILLYVEKAH